MGAESSPSISLFLSSYYPSDSTRHGPLARLLALTETAEEHGFRSVFLGHHFLTSSQFLQPVPLAGYLAARTERLRIGFGVYLLPLDNPLIVAEELATVDALSGGRVIAGFGAGYRRREFEAVGVPFADRFKRLEEYVGVVRALWAGETVNVEGSFGTLRDARLHLTSVQNGGPAIWVGAFGDIGIRRCARLGVAWFAGPEGTMAVLTERVALFHSELEERGIPRPSDLPISREVLVAPTTAEARELARPHLEAQYRDYKSWDHGLDGDLLVQENAVVGDPEDVIKRLLQYRDLGFTEIVMRIDWPGLPRSAVERTLRLLADEVLPALR